MDDVEADSGGEMEAGTTQRDVVRLGVVSIPVSFSVSPKWLKVLTGFKQNEKISVEYFDTETLEMKRTEMFIEGYKAVLVKDTSYKGLWKVSFYAERILAQIMSDFLQDVWYDGVARKIKGLKYSEWFFIIDTVSACKIFITFCSK